MEEGLEGRGGREGEVMEGRRGWREEMKGEVMEGMGGDGGNRR